MEAIAGCLQDVAFHAFLEFLGLEVGFKIFCQKASNPTRHKQGAKMMLNLAQKCSKYSQFGVHLQAQDVGIVKKVLYGAKGSVNLAGFVSEEPS